MFFIPDPHMKAAACKDLDERDKRRFFDGSDNARIKAICQGCPVKSQCLEQVLEIEHQPGALRRWGIWGGTTPNERYDVYGPLPDQEGDIVDRWGTSGYVKHREPLDMQEAEMYEPQEATPPRVLRDALQASA